MAWPPSLGCVRIKSIAPFLFMTSGGFYMWPSSLREDDVTMTSFSSPRKKWRHCYIVFSERRSTHLEPSSGATYFSIPINFFEKKSCTKFPFPPYRTVRPLFTFLKCLLECPGKFLIIAPKVLLLCFKIRQKFALGNRPYLFRISVMRLENFLIHRFPHQFYFKANK